MRFGLIFSILLHALVLAAFIITIKRMPLLAETPDIPVEVTTVAELANVKAASKLQEQKETPAPTPTPAPPPPQQSAQAENPPAPIPPAPAEPTPAPKVTPKEPPKPEVEPKSRPTPPTPDKKKDQKFDLDSIAALINKEQKSQEKQVKTAQANPGDKSEKPREQVGAGTDMTITLIQLLQRQIYQCWTIPIGAAQPESLVIGITINFRRDGTLAGPPQLDDTSRMSEPFYRAAAENAVRAIIQCAPYQMPADQYDEWKTVDFEFDPSKAAGMSSQQQ